MWIGRFCFLKEGGVLMCFKRVVLRFKRVVF